MNVSTKKKAHFQGQHVNLPEGNLCIMVFGFQAQHMGIRQNLLIRRSVTVIQLWGTQGLDSQTLWAYGVSMAWRVDDLNVMIW